MKTVRVLVLFISLIFGFSLTAQTVYTTKTGEKYHKSNCRYLKHSKKEITLERAIARGYMACKVCKPTASNTKTKSNSITTKKESTPTSSKKANVSQCTGKTTAGKRCKRNTKNANGRCYQH